MKRPTLLSGFVFTMIAALLSEAGAYGVDPTQTCSITITRQPPASLRRSAGSPFTISVGVNAFPTSSVSYQWFKDGVMVSGATNATYTVAQSVKPCDEGTYRLQIVHQDPLCEELTVTTVPCVVSLLGDPAPLPQLLAARIHSPTNVVLDFSEAMKMDLASINNFTFDPPVRVLGLAGSNFQRIITLATEPLPSVPLTLTIHGLVSTKSFRNQLSPDPTVVHLAAATGIPLNTLQIFDALPPAYEWSGLTNGLGGNAFAKASLMDASIVTNSAGLITNRLISGTTTDGNRLPRWNSLGQFVYTRPVGLAYTMLMATIQNTGGSTLPGVSVSYDLFTPNVISGEDLDLAGHRAFFSLTGTPNSWTLIPEFTTAVPGTGVASLGRLTAILELGAWTPGALLYILWADDNGDPGGDGSFAIDNFIASPVDQLPCISSEPQSVTEFAWRTVSLSVGIAPSGESCDPPKAFQWFKDGSLINPIVNPSTATATLVITNAQISDSGDYHVIVANPIGATSSQTARVHILPDVIPPALHSAFPVFGLRNAFSATVSEQLCLNRSQCGTDARCALNWDIVPVLGGGVEGESLGVTNVVVSGTNLTFTTARIWQYGQQYRVKVVEGCDVGVSDLSGNLLSPGDSGSVTPTLPMLVFQQNSNGYTGTHDTYLRSEAPDAIEGDSSFFELDTINLGGGLSQGLLRFDNLFGPGGILAGAGIISSRLILQHIGSSEWVNLHRMIVPWDEATATWNVLDGGIQLPIDAEFERNSSITLSMGPPPTLELDVTPHISAWSRGDLNHGWALISDGPAGLRINSSESSAPPALAVLYDPREGSPRLSIVSSEAKLVVSWLADSRWVLQRANALSGPYVTVNPTSGANVHTNMIPGSATNLFFRLHYSP